MAQKTSFYKTPEMEKILNKFIKKHGSLSKALNVMAISLDTMYRIERSYLRQLFEQPELDLMLNNALSTHYQPEGIVNRVLWDTEDEADNQFEYFGVDKSILLDKLRSLSVSQQYALVDWLMEMRGEEPVESEESEDTDL